jgi:hypothetical protein
MASAMATFAPGKAALPLSCRGSKAMLDRKNPVARKS